MMRSRSRSIWLRLALCGALPAQRAYAQAAPPPVATAEAKAAAQAAADRGKELYDAGKYGEAITAFNEAD